MDFSIRPDERFKRYYVLFRNTRVPVWWTRFTVPGLEHCSVIEEVSSPEEGLLQRKYCVYTDACYGLLVNQIHWEAASSVVADALVKRAITAVVVVDVEKTHQRMYIPFGLWTCVTVAKALLGVRDWRIQTPQSLFRYLDKRGAIVVRSE